MIPEIIKISADPAPGAEISYTADEDMIVHSAYYTFVTSAAVGNRLASLVADDGNAANIFWRSNTNGLLTATLSVPISAFEGASVMNNSSLSTIPLPMRGLRLRKGDRLRSLTNSLDAGDNYSAIVLQAERTMEGAQ